MRIKEEIVEKIRSNLLLYAPLLHRYNSRRIGAEIRRFVQFEIEWRNTVDAIAQLSGGKDGRSADDINVFMMQSLAAEVARKLQKPV